MSVYELLYGFIGLDATELDCPELYYNFIAGMSCVMVVAIIYLVLWFFLSLFRGQK